MAKIKFATGQNQGSGVISAGLALLLCLLIPSISPSPAVAATDEVRWSRFDIPAQGEAGGWVLADGSDIQHLTMAIDGSLYAYAAGLTYTLYKSTSGGYGWSHIGGVRDSIVAIATAPDDASLVYYATASRVYRSADGGKTFSALPASPGGSGSNNVEITSIDVAPYNDSHIVAVGTRDTDNAQFGGVYFLDEGEVITSWVDTGIGSYDVYAAAFSPDFTASHQVVAVATDETDTLVTFKTGDAGWGAVTGNAILDRDNSGTHTSVAVAVSAAIAFPGDYGSDGATENSVQFITIDTGTGNGDVYKITSAATPDNSAATDLNVGSAYGLSNIDVTGLAVSGTAASASLLAGAADSSQTYFSNDDGSNWTRSRKEPTGGSKTYVVMSPEPGRAYAATSGSESAFSTSQDNGTTWNQVGLIDTQINTIIDLAPSPGYSRDNTIFMLTFGGKHSLWRSLDGGTTWDRPFTSALPNADNINLVGLPPQYSSNGNQVVFLAGSSYGNPVIWKSTDNGQSFTSRPAVAPDTGASLTIDVWTIVNNTTLFIGSYDGSNALVYRTTNSGFSYSTGALAGSQWLNSIVLSPGYEQDKTILIGNASGWVYWSDNDGLSFEPLPPDAATPPLAGSVSVAFDPGFDSNHIVYAASATADKGVFRFAIGTSNEWESIDGTLPAGSRLDHLIVTPEGTLYAANSKAGEGMERCLNPAYPLGPLFETVKRDLNDTATLSRLWQCDHRLWSIDTTNTTLMTFNDSLTSPVIPTSPQDKAPGIGALSNHTIHNVSLDWETLSGATGYHWQLDFDTDFSAVPAGFEGDTGGSSVRLPALEPDTTYHWRVRATDPVLSPWAARWSFTTSLDTEVIEFRPESPRPGAASVPVRPLFQWSAVAGADAYELLLSPDVNFTDPSIIRMDTFALPANTWECNVNLEYDTTYYWKVRATNANTFSAWSAVSAFTTEAAPHPPAPAQSAPAVSPSVNPTPQAHPQPTVTPPPALITTHLPVVSMPAATPPATTPAAPPAPNPVLFENTPAWVIYLIGALLLAIILLLIIILVLVAGVRRI